MRALVIVDIQNDFIPGGALAVPHGDEVIPIINQLPQRFDVITATQDWHPPDHGSFAASHPGRKTGEIVDLNGLQQILWPVHCVQNTPGAQFAAALDRARVEKVFHKGIDRGIDSYSTFFDNAHRRSTGLGEYLKSKGVTDVYLAGLATDYCVLYSALDARHLNFNVYVIENACRGIDLHPGDVARALDQMKRNQVHIINSDEI